MVDRLDWDKERKRQLVIKRLYGTTVAIEEKPGHKSAKRLPSKTHYLRKLRAPERWMALKAFKAACDRLIEFGDTNTLFRWFENLPAGRYRDEVIYPFLKERVGVGLVQHGKGLVRRPRFKKFKRYRQLSSLDVDEYKQLVQDMSELLGLELE